MGHTSIPLLCLFFCCSCTNFPTSPLVDKVQRTHSQSSEIAFLREKLQSKDGPTRGVAANQLAFLGAFEAIPDFRAILHDDDLQMASFAIAALRELSATEAIADIRPYLVSHEPALRIVAGGALMVLADDEPVEDMIELATHSDTKVRQLLCQSLLLFADERSLPGLLTLMRDQDPEIQTMAVIALGRVGDHSAIEELEFLLTSNRSKLRIGALRALAQISPGDYVPELEAALESKDRSEVEAALLGLIALRSPKAKRHLLANAPTNPALNMWIMPEQVIAKLEAAELPLRDIRWLPFAEIANKIEAAIGIEIDFADSIERSPRNLQLDPSAIALGHRPNALTLLSLPRVAWRDSHGIEWVWIYESDRIRYVTAQQAAAFFRTK